MEIAIELYEAPDLKARFESGERIACSHETFAFKNGGTTFVFTLDNLGTATLRTMRANDQSRFVETLDRVLKNTASLPLFKEALVYLHEQRSVQYVSVYNRPAGQYQRHSINDLITSAQLRA